MKRLLTFSLTIIFASISILVFSQQSNWKLVHESKEDQASLQIFTRDIPGSPYKEFKGVSFSDIPFDIALKVIQDYNNYHKWYGMCNALYPINVRSPKDLDMYFNP